MPNPESSKRFCFTLYQEVKQEDILTFNDDRAVEIFNKLHEKGAINYACWQTEKGCQEGKVHLQGYFELAAKGSKGYKRKSTVGKFLRGFCDDGDAYSIFFRYMNFAIAKGSAEQNKIYCHKETCDYGEDVCQFTSHARNEVGEAVTQGRRTDVLDVKEAIDSGILLSLRESAFLSLIPFSLLLELTYLSYPELLTPPAQEPPTESFGTPTLPPWFATIDRSAPIAPPVWLNVMARSPHL